METVTNWSALWRELVEGSSEEGSESRGGGADPDQVWRHRAREFDALAKRREQAADPLRDFVASRVDTSTTVLDIGAGTGKWVTFLAPRVRQVTALDPSPSMLAVLRENLAANDIRNVTVIQGAWPATEVASHDVTLCAHAVYSVPDLEAFVRRMMDVTRRSCFLVLKCPIRHGVMAEASMRLRGHPYDGPNFAMAYNILLDMGLCPNVLVDPFLWEPWANSSMEEALSETKRRLKISGTTEHDEYLRDLLGRHLTYQDGKYVWPRGVRSVLVYWDLW